MKRGIWGELWQLARSVDRELIVRDWSTKALALVLALVVFFATRDQVSRTFWIPLDVRQDNDRRLLSELPSKVGVEVRGPWSHVKQLNPRAFGHAKIDLRVAKEGPLEIDAATIVIPQGVFLANRELEYDPVDLRFDPIVERKIKIVPKTVGMVHRYSELVSIDVRPSQWLVRGPEIAVSKIAQLETEPIKLESLQDSIVRRVKLNPVKNVQFVGLNEFGSPTVEVQLELLNRESETTLTVDVDSALRESGIHLDGPVPPHQQVRISGPQFWLEAIQSYDKPIRVEVVSQGKDSSSNLTQIEFRLRWEDDLTKEVKTKLRIEPAVVRLLLRVRPNRSGR